MSPYSFVLYWVHVLTLPTKKSILLFFFFFFFLLLSFYLMSQAWIQYIWINIDILTLCCDLGLECSNPLFFSQNTLAYDDASSDQVWLPKNQQFTRHRRKIIFWLYEPSLWPWSWRYHKKNFGAWHSGSWCCIKMFCGSEYIIQTKKSLTFWILAVTLNTMLTFQSKVT